MTGRVIFSAIPGIPEVQVGADVARLLLAALAEAAIPLADGDILAVAQKIISKAEGRQVRLASVTPSPRALALAAKADKDPRLVELILQESEVISRVRPGVLIVRHRLGFTSANAGIDRSNVLQSGGDESVLLLPLDPDASAARLRQAIGRRTGRTIGVIITDSHGRPFRLGSVGMALGVAGLPALWDRRGQPDRYGHTLQSTQVALADELAAAAGVVMGQAAEGQPAVLIQGVVLPPGIEGRAADLIRPKEKDLFS